jgi:hypothetical protein
MVARLVASSVDDVSCSATWLRQVLMWLGGWWSDLAREYCASRGYLVGTGYAPSVVLVRIFMGTSANSRLSFKLRQGLTHREKYKIAAWRSQRKTENTTTLASPPPID